ncbi:MAG: porin, partial [Marinifilaceae bacterium]
VLLCTIMSMSTLFAQNAEKSLAERLNLVEKQNDSFSFYLNMQNRGNVEFLNGSFSKAYFKNEQLRMEMRGSISNMISYRLRHRLNKSNVAQNLDGIAKATDIAAVGITPMDNFTITLGKQCAAYGGFEFDLNPIDIYQYSDMIDYMDNFLAGIDFAYGFNNQEFRFQVLDARSSKFEDVYSAYSNGGVIMNNNMEAIEASKAPLLYTLNWNGNILDGRILTRWSYTYGSDARSQHINYVALGTQVKVCEMLKMQFDWMNSKEDIDRKGIISDLNNHFKKAAYMNNKYLAANAKYDSYVLKFDVKAFKDWNIMLKGMYETATADGLSSKAREAYGFVGGVEYAPFDDDIKFFANYTRRDYSFARDAYGTDYDTERYSIGLVYRLKMF